MKNKLDKDEIIFIIIIVITGVLAFFLGNIFHVRYKKVFFLLVLIEVIIFCMVKKLSAMIKEANGTGEKEKIYSQNSMQERFDKICDYCNKLENADYDTYKIFPPISINKIESWEKQNQVMLPNGYKDWILLANGFEIESNVLYPLGNICRYPEKEYEDYFIIGSYIGDGSLLLTDKYGIFYELDHEFGLEESTMVAFLDEHVIRCLKDGMNEIGGEL